MKNTKKTQNTQVKKVQTKNAKTDNTKTRSHKNGSGQKVSKEHTTASVDESKAVVAEARHGAHVEEKYMWLNNAVLQICPEFQRKLKPMRVAEIVANFSPLIANPIKVSYRDGEYNMFDGMHTRTALCRINGTDDFPIFCRVYYGLTKEDEAELFAAQFGISEPVSMPYRLRALEVAKDPSVLEFLKSTRDRGFSISLGSHTSRNGQIAATCQAYKAFCELGGNEYGRMLDILHRTWAGESWSVSKYMLAGMTRLMKMYDVKPEAFVKVFRRIGQKEIMDMADEFIGMSRDGAVASALAELFDQCSAGGAA